MSHPTPQTLAPTSVVDLLRTAVAGVVHAPEDEGYRLSATGFNLATVHRSAAVVVASSAADVAAAVRIAAENGLTVAVQATGHGAAPAPENSILVDTALLDGVSINRAERTATVEAGVRWQQVLDAAAPHGLAPLAARHRASGWSGTRSAAGSARSPAPTGSPPTGSCGWRSSPPTGSCGGSPPTTNPTCSGPCSAAARHSGSSPR
ncbi:FAD-binding protein [Rhodococcus aetherivorans]